jgi:hypothetical protein
MRLRTCSTATRRCVRGGRQQLSETFDAGDLLQVIPLQLGRLLHEPTVLSSFLVMLAECATYIETVSCECNTQHSDMRSTASTRNESYARPCYESSTKPLGSTAVLPHLPPKVFQVLGHDLFLHPNGGHGNGLVPGFAARVCTGGACRARHGSHCPKAQRRLMLNVLLLCKPWLSTGGTAPRSSHTPGTTDSSHQAELSTSQQGLSHHTGQH